MTESGVRCQRRIRAALTSEVPLSHPQFVTRALIASSVVSFASLLSGCFGDAVIACDFRERQSRCQERHGTQAANPPAFEALCGTSNGDYIDGPCPTAGVVAGCEMGDVIDWYYAPRTREDVVSSCEGDGDVIDP